MKKLIVLFAISLLCNIIAGESKKINAQTFECDTLVETIQDLPINGGVDIYFKPFFGVGEYYTTDTLVNYGVEKIASNACIQFIPYFRFGNPDTTVKFRFELSYNESSLGNYIPVFDKFDNPFSEIDITLTQSQYNLLSYEVMDSISKANIQYYMGGNLSKEGTIDSVVEYSYKFEKNGTHIALKSNRTDKYFYSYKKTYTSTELRNLTFQGMGLDNYDILTYEYGNNINIK